MSYDNSSRYVRSSQNKVPTYLERQARTSWKPATSSKHGLKSKKVRRVCLICPIDAQLFPRLTRRGKSETNTRQKRRRRRQRRKKSGIIKKFRFFLFPEKGCDEKYVPVLLSSSSTMQFPFCKTTSTDFIQKHPCLLSLFLACIHDISCELVYT